MNCPKCHKEVEEFHRVWSDKPFTAKEALPGLAAWGGIDVARTILCEKGQFVHFKFDHIDVEHLVEMVPDLPQKRQTIREHYESMKHPCDHEGCTADGWPGWSLWGDEEPIGWTCDKHAQQQGFCSGCHTFMAGMESFDFSPSGLCDDCSEELLHEMGEDDWDDEFEEEFDL